MLNSIIRKPALVLTVPLFALLAASYPAHAEIYKWRDNRGVIQYSDRPPVENFTKATSNEMVNALQTKDLCTTGPIVKSSPVNVASNQNVGAFFSKFLRASTTTSSPTTTVSLLKASSSSGKLSRASTTSTRSGSTSTNTKNISFLSGGKSVTVLGFSKKPIKTSTTSTTTTTTTTSPTTTTTTSPTSTTTIEPTSTTTTTEPVLVATAGPTSTTTTTNSTSSTLIQVGLMPTVDISKNMIPALGASTLRIAPTTEVASNGFGEFRIVCTPSHMSNDDPVVYPNQQGAAHHHTFFGNVTTDYKSDLMTLSSTGNSTCSGGIMNRSSYWAPSMIDTTTNAAIVPSFSIFYYKTGVDGSLVTPPPKGLRMIAGNSKATDSLTAQSQYTCVPPEGVSRPFFGWSKHIPSCPAGDSMQMAVGFPQCWDGKNLDSPNHKDHMANDVGGVCPSTHPVAIPQITEVLYYKVNAVNETSKWRLSSDNYAFNGSNAGYSAHADWVNGWDEAAMASVVKNCINAKKDGHAHLLCDGRMFY